MKHLFSIFMPVMFLATVLSVGSCSLFDKDDYDPVTPVLTPSEVTLAEYEETAVAISEGEAPYQLSGGNAYIASVTINDNAIDIKALKAGTSIVTVKGNDGGTTELVITVTKGQSAAPELTRSTVEVRAGELISVEVANGVMPFRLSGGDATIASVAINNATITVKGLRLGTTTVTVTGQNGLSTNLTIQVTESLAEAEQDRYSEFVTPELENVLVNKLGITVNRGISPPDLTGYFLMKTYCTKSTISGDSYVGKLIDDFKIKFYDQRNIEISLSGFEVKTGTDDFLYHHEAIGTFICGEGDKFSVFFNETIQGADNTYSTNFALFSGELVKDANKTVIGIKNFQYVLLMRENNGNPKLIANGEGRLFEDDYVEVISKERFETVIGRLSAKRATANQSALSVAGNK